ncbi:hypothetical protein MJN85_32010, partial [Salmonella enterica subsp. enterica serovar Anatum]|nr:hypothetical protein [Salmonella enterica subsp. enterica serovar Anatum]
MSSVKKIGLFACTGVVAGNMVAITCLKNPILSTYIDYMYVRSTHQANMYIFFDFLNISKFC